MTDRQSTDTANSARPAKKRPVKSAKRTVKTAGRAAVSPSWAQAGEVLTTRTGVAVDDTDNSLAPALAGPTLLEDFHLREKIMHFDHERIPERVVHARGAGAHGHFRAHRVARQTSRVPGSLATPRRQTPVFVRFSTVAGSRGSADTARDVRGFAVKFYTDDGIFDLVGNNIPVFFIQDGIKFPDLIHAAKPEPDREIPQAQTAHDTFWDFVSLTPESDAHADVGHVGPGHSALVPDDGGIRRPHVPARQRSRRDDAREVPLEAGAPECTRSCGRSPRSSAASTPTSIGVTSGTPSRPASSPNGTSGCRSSRTPTTRRSTASTCSTRPSSSPRSWRRCASSAA